MSPKSLCFYGTELYSVSVLEATTKKLEYSVFVFRNSFYQRFRKIYRVWMRLDPVQWKNTNAIKAWTNCPYVYRNVDNRQMKLNANWADNVNQNFSAPTVRDCSRVILTSHPASCLSR
jgi:hypothetical protein